MLVSRPRESVTQSGEESPSSSSESAVEAAAARLPKILPTVGLNIARVTVNDTKLTLWVRSRHPLSCSLIIQLCVTHYRVCSRLDPLTSLVCVLYVPTRARACVCVCVCVCECDLHHRTSAGHRIYVEYVRVSIAHGHICRCIYACCLFGRACVCERALAHVAMSRVRHDDDIGER